MEVGEYGLTRGTCIVARRVKVVAVAGLLWTSWRVLGAAGFYAFFRSCVFERTRPAASMRPPCLIYLSTSTGVRTELHYLNSLSVCHLCCIAHQIKSAVRTITSIIIETGIWSESAAQNPLGSFNTLRSFTGTVLPTEASK